MAVTAARLPGPLLAALALAAVAHLPALRAGFVQDDLAVVEASPVVARGSIAQIVSSSWWRDSRCRTTGAVASGDDRELCRRAAPARRAVVGVRARGERRDSPRRVRRALRSRPSAERRAVRGGDRGGAVRRPAGARRGGLQRRRPRRLLAGLFTLAAALVFRNRASRTAPWIAAAFAAAAIGIEGDRPRDRGRSGGDRRDRRRGVARLAGWIPVLALAGAAVMLRTWALEGFFPTRACRRWTTRSPSSRWGRASPPRSPSSSVTPRSSSLRSPSPSITPGRSVPLESGC